MDKNKLKITSKRIKDGTIRKQKAWQYIYEINSVSEDRLNATALIDNSGNVSYRKMFRMWKSYAEAFSALGITKENHSRIGLLGVNVTEMITALYAADMVGAMASGLSATLQVGSKRFKKTIIEEGLTDLFIMDTFIDPKALKTLLDQKEELGLRNIILVHIKLDFTKDNLALLAFNELNYLALRNMEGAVYWKDLLDKYDSHPIYYADYSEDDIVLALHTSGTTKGISKPMFFTDFAWNGVVHRIRKCKEINDLPPNPKNAIYLDLSASYAVFQQLHFILSIGGTVCETYLRPFTDTQMSSAVNSSSNIMMTAGPEFIDYFKLPESKTADFSDIKMLILGGAYLPKDLRKAVNKYVKEHGSTARVINGYGLSEVGGACIISPSDYDDDSIGFPLDGVNVRIYDESDNKYYKIEEGPRTGILHINADAMSCGKLDGKTFFETVDIDGLPYINTYDMVKVNKNGSLTYVGRCDRYFANNEGVRFNAGMVDVAISAQKGVLGCALAPVYSKQYHDSVPVLYIKVKGKDKVNVAEKAILSAYSSGKLLKNSNLPMKCVITDELPYNTNGKVDVYKITKGDVKGDIYFVQGVYKDGKLTDIVLEKTEFIRSLIIDEKESVPDELVDDSRPVGITALKAFVEKWELMI